MPSSKPGNKKKPTKKKPPPKKKGRPSKIDGVNLAEVEKMAKLGLTNEQIAGMLGIRRETIWDWCRKHPDFSNAIKAGKKVADDLVERSLFARAVGYAHPEDKIMVSKGKTIVVPTIKHYPPDPTSCIFWLKNRRKDEWKDKVGVEGDDENPLKMIVYYPEKKEPGAK